VNPSFFAFPQQTNLHQLGIRTYDSSGVYEIMPGTKGLYIFAVSGGGGGGGGGRRPTSGNCNGGGGGAGGASGLWYFRVEEIGGIGSSLFIVIGAGGTAGSAGSADGTSGGSGGQAGSTRIYSLGRGQTVQTYANARASLISLFNDQLTGAGGGGTSAALGGGGNGYFSEIYGASGSLGSNGQTSGASIVVTTINNSGGAGGGGHNSGTPTLGGLIYISAATSIPQTIALDDAKNTAVYQGGGANNGVQPPNSSKQIFGLFSPGFGGAGGASGTSQAATNGGNGYRGSGGGGGGGSANGFAAGAGGTGGNGFVAIKAVFS